MCTWHSSTCTATCGCARRCATVAALPLYVPQLQGQRQVRVLNGLAFDSCCGVTGLQDATVTGVRKPASVERVKRVMFRLRREVSVGLRRAEAATAAPVAASAAGTPDPDVASAASLGAGTGSGAGAGAGAGAVPAAGAGAALVSVSMDAGVSRGSGAPTSTAAASAHEAAWRLQRLQMLDMVLSRVEQHVNGGAE